MPWRFGLGADMAAQQLTADIWLVGTSMRGAAFTDPYDCNQYLIWDGSNGVLIDSGGGRGTEAWLNNIADVVNPARLNGLLITHYHADHAGGASAARAAGLAVFGSPTCVDAVGRGDEDVTQLAAARRAGVYPADFALQAADGLSPIGPGQRTYGSLTIQTIEAPGHCDGHLVFALKIGAALALFTGDTVFPQGRVSIQAIPDCRLDRYADTVQRLSHLPIGGLYPGHGEADLDAGSAHAAVRDAAATFARLQLPPNHVS